MSAKGKRARRETNAHHSVVVPRDALADTIDYAGLHKDVLFDLANHESSDVWSDAVVVSREPWGPLGVLRHHVWKPSNGKLPPLLVRSLTFDPHRWIRLIYLCEEGFKALHELSPKSLHIKVDLTGNFLRAIRFKSHRGTVATVEPLISNVERVKFDAVETPEALELVNMLLPRAKHLKELFLPCDTCNPELIDFLEQAGVPHLAKCCSAAADARKWWNKDMFRTMDNVEINDRVFYTKVDGKRYTMDECFQRAISNPYIDITTGFLFWIDFAQKKGFMAESRERANFAFEALRRRWYLGYLDEITHYESPLWDGLAKFLHEENAAKAKARTPSATVTVGGVTFTEDECHLNSALVQGFNTKWVALAEKLHKSRKKSVKNKYDQLRKLSAKAVTLSRIDCLGNAVYSPRLPEFGDDDPSIAFIHPEEWLHFPHLMEPGDVIRSLLPRSDSEPEPRSFSAFDCCEVALKGPTSGYQDPMVYSSGYLWSTVLQVFSRQKDFETTINTPDGPVDWRCCATRALAGPFRDEYEADSVWKNVADNIPEGAAVEVDGRRYTKLGMYVHRLESRKTSHVAWNNIALVLHRSRSEKEFEYDGKVYTMKACFERSLELNPRDLVVWKNLANVCLRTSDDVATIFGKTYTRTECIAIAAGERSAPDHADDT